MALDILIIGYGEMGHAMEYLLAPQQRLQIWQRHPIPGKTLTQLEPVAAQADAIILCLPANAIAEVAQHLRTQLKPSCLCLSIAKGLDEQGRPAASILSQTLQSSQAHGVIYGPMIAEELRAGKPGFAQLAATTEQALVEAQQLFADSALYLETSDDITGLSWAACLKNVYAIAFGIADELGLGDNMRGFLAVAAIREMGAIIATLGGHSDTPLHLAGLGDLITTATSAGSHHHELGQLLVRGQSGLSGEGVHTLAMIQRHQLFALDDYPLAALVASLLHNPAHCAQAMQDYLSQH